MEGATTAKLTSMHFYAWKSGLKTGMYYLRTKSAVDAIKFTLDNKKKKEPVKEIVETDVAISAAAPKSASKSASKSAPKSASKPAANPSNIEVEPLAPEELKEMLKKAKESEDDDCLMCGS